MVRLALALCLVSCSSTSAQTSEPADASTENSGPPSFGSFDAADDRSPLLKVTGEIDQVCSQDGCHGNSAGGMGLHTGAEFDAMIDVPSTEVPSMLRVRPGDPEHSYVYLKVACEGGILDACMPFGSMFNPSVKQAFHDWIEAGAPTQ